MAGRPISDPEMVDYVLAGLDRDYDPVVAAIGAIKNQITVDDLFAQIVAFDQRVEMLGDGPDGGFKTSANLAYRGRGRGYSRGRGRSSSRGHGRGRRPSPTPSGGHGGGRGGRGRPQQQRQQQEHDYPECQIYYKHYPGGARDCWHRYDEDEPEEKSANMVTNSYGVDTNWYADTGASHHITGELDKLTFKEKYHGHDQVHTASGSGMKVAHIGHSIVKTPKKTLHLNKVLHVPEASQNLLSVHRFTLDNRVLIEFYPYFFLVKDLDTRRVLLRGKCVGGLYPLISSSSLSSNKQAFVAVKPSSAKWHSRLGHPSSAIVKLVLSKNKLPHSHESSVESICDPCQQAKSHQLPYPISFSVSTAPLQLVFSDVWGPAPTSVGRHSYYVSFIDDYSKFTWIYLLKKRSEVFQVFKNFQNLVERKLNTKIIAMQTD